MLTIVAVVDGTMITRFTPFLLFPESKEPPRVIRYLGDVLPYAIGGLLVVYALRNTDLTGPTRGIPELVALLVVVVLHLWRHSMILSIAGGTIAYMLLVQFVF
ncbi:branched-chain amino acid transporter permease [Bifidobacterium pullorum]|nr:AzlD domain-containing protein [Bifidobacterium pullorum]